MLNSYIIVATSPLLQQLSNLSPEQMKMVGVASSIGMLIVLFVSALVAIKVLKTAMSIVKRLIVIALTFFILSIVALAAATALLLFL